MDFNKLRASALNHGEDEEAVTVNTRALIDKVLARYSGEWTTLRELIQNAADAQASTVRIKFETLPSTSIPLPNTTNKSELLKHILLHHTLRSLVVSNDGQAFGVNDWARLKRIAEGNPDETKIGAFGVGFYSVFADCEDPFVSSGNQAMAFFWKGNSLFTRRLQLPPDQANPETSFVLDYRNTTTPMPNLLSIAQFLATSLTFVALKGIELWVDEYKIVSLRKKAAPSVALPIGRDVDTKTKEGLMKVQSLEKEGVQMDAEFMNVVGWKPTLMSSVPKPSQEGYSSGEVPSLRSFFSRLTSAATKSSAEAKAQREENAFQEIVLEDLTKLTTANVFLRVTTATVKTSVNSSFAAELERATKKPPPKITRLATLTSSYDEMAASSQDSAVATKVDIFASVLPGKKPGGRIFIGFPTHQTTGAGMHLSAPSVIPTVERESIDLNARWVRTWNVEMLRVAGIIARLAFANEMSDLSHKIKRACEAAGHPNKVTKKQVAQFMPEALHILKTFTFVESTPSSKVSEIIEEAFWTTYKHPYIDIYSTQGVLPTSNVRLATEDLSGFVEGIPVVPDELVKGAFVTKLRDFGIITEITFEDVRAELGAKALTQSQLMQFISWAGKKALSGHLNPGNVASLMNVAVATTGDEEGHGEILTLGTIRNYLNVSKIPADARIPPTTIPFQFSKNSTIDELLALGWEPLEIVPWLRYLIESNGNAPPEQDFTKSHDYAVKVLQILSKAWDGLGQSSKATVVSLLSAIPIVPTKFGMKKPGEAFFESVKLFDDLPTITRCPGVKEKFWAAIGVRKTVDLETIFTRLLAPTDSKSDGASQPGRHMQLIKYLASVSGDIPAEDLKKLKTTPICPAEAGPAGSETSQGTSRLYKVSELFEPKDALRTLGLPVLLWLGPPGSYRAASPEGRFLNKLGLRAYPSVPELIDMMSSTDGAQRKRAMEYFIANHHINNYIEFNVAATSKKFIPIRNDEKLVAPTECFTNEHCAILGFDILSKELQPHATKLGVAKDPRMIECVHRLAAKPPPNYREAVTIFNYFASRLSDLGPSDAIKLSEAKIVPVAAKGLEGSYPIEKGSSRYLTPLQCYLGNSSKYGDIFDFVDFGELANAFLLKCGAKHEPTSIELAALASKEPARLLGIMKSPEKYLSLLKTLAEDMAILKRDRELWKQLKAAKWLLGSKDIPNDKNQKTSEKSLLDKTESEDEDEPASIKQYELAAPRQIVVVDDYNAYRLFKSSLICAPQDDVTEDFYLALGAGTLGSLVEEQLRLGPIIDRESTSAKLRAHVLERSKIFLYEYQTRPKEIRHDARWMERNLRLQVVASISLRRSLKGHSLGHTEKRSAAYQADRMRGYTLFVTADNPDTYQLSQALCSLMLERPSQSSYVLFESFLSLSLYQLRSRGYNVDRILRAKAAEARLAEEQQKKQYEQEQERVKELEDSRKAQELEAQKQTKALPAPPTPATPVPERPQSKGKKSLDMPGAFGSDSPETSSSDQNPNNSVRDLFSRFTRRFNNNNSSVERNPLAFGGSSDDERPPPPYSDNTVTAPKGGEERVSSPASILASLQSGISASRAHSSSTLQSKQHQDSTNTVKEASSFCNPAAVHNLVSIGSAASGMKVFVDKQLSSGAQGWLATNKKSLDIFETVLRDAAEIFGVPTKAVHIFFDVSGSTIAFNQGGSLWANFRYWQQLHEARCASGDASMRVEPLAYWWVTLAHELAHNLRADHDAEHGFFTQSYISEYFPAMFAKATSYATSRS